MFRVACEITEYSELKKSSLLLMTSEFARTVAQKEGKMTNSTNVTNVKMTRLNYRVDSIKEIHVTDKGGTKIVTRETEWDDIIAERL